jgi:L-lactate dehydrogenase complex protein LldE
VKAQVVAILEWRYNTWAARKQGEIMAETVQLFATCLLDTLYPDVGDSVVRILNRCGAKVEFPPGQTCCGQPAYNAGMRMQARKMAEHTIRVFEPTPGPVVVPSGSCAAMIRYSYLELFAGDDLWLPRARRLAERTVELTEYLVDMQGMTDFNAHFPGKITYHSSCHLLRELKVDRQPRLLLQAVQDAELIELSGTQECCGFGGVFSVEHPEISAAMLERKIENIVASGADVVISCDAGCITHINGGLHRRGLPPRAIHIAQLIDGLPTQQA